METNTLAVEVQRIHKLSNGKSLKAFADIKINDAILIKGITVMDGKKGLFVSMPREQSAKDKKWYDSVKCLDKQLQEEITEKVLEAYGQES